MADQSGQFFTAVCPEDLPPAQLYRLLISAVIPRPIAWITSRGANGSLNCAPFSFFNAVGGPPPVLMVSIGTRKGVAKDTLRNLKETGECVVHIVSHSLAESMNLTSADLPYGESEIGVAGIATVDSDLVNVPRLADAGVAMETRALQFVAVAATGYTISLLEILRFHIRCDLLDEKGLIGAVKLDPIARLGGDQYTDLGSVFSMPRP